MELYLIRHGHHPDGFRGGWSQHGLSEEGRRQVSRLVDRLQRERFMIDTLISSDLPRAAQTAEAIGLALNQPVTYDSAWREVDNGALAGMPEEEARSGYPGLFWNSLAWDEPYPGGGESPKAFLERIESALAGLKNSLTHGRIGPRVAVVTHGGPIRAGSCLLTGQTFSNRHSSFKAHETSIHQFRLKEGRWAVVNLGDIAHLDVK